MRESVCELVTNGEAILKISARSLSALISCYERDFLCSCSIRNAGHQVPVYRREKRGLKSGIRTSSWNLEAPLFCPPFLPHLATCFSFSSSLPDLWPLSSCAVTPSQQVVLTQARVSGGYFWSVPPRMFLWLPLSRATSLSLFPSCDKRSKIDPPVLKTHAHIHTPKPQSFASSFIQSF